MDDAQLLSFGIEAADTNIQIRQYYDIPPIFDHIIKFHYQGTEKKVVVVGNQSDLYYAVHARNILREECGLSAPLVDIHLLPRIHLEGFDEILVCYNRHLVSPYLQSWQPPQKLSIVYLDDLISMHHWIFAIAESLSRVFSLRDIVRGLLGQPVEETRALQFDAWAAVSRAMQERAKQYRNVFIYGSGCGVLPLLLRKHARIVRVYESNPVYLNNIRVAQHLGKLSVYDEAQFAEDMDRATDEDCVIFCDALNRTAEPALLSPLLARAGRYYLTAFLSSRTKPEQAAIFRTVREGQNVPFGREDRRDRRCYGATHSIWLPRENALRETLGAEYRTIYESNEHFGRAEEYASGYVALSVGG